MEQSILQLKKLHVACIMDGNGRWATRRGLPRSAGHRQGVETVREIVEAASEQGVGTLTLYAFSSDNWKRPVAEVGVLMHLLQTYLRREVKRCLENGVRLSVIGRRDRLPKALQSAIAEAEAKTRNGATLHLRIAVDYSARDALLRAACRFRHETVVPSAFAFARLISGDDAPAPDVDVLIRTGGEHRLSDFLLWESAYAELFFLDTCWPDFTPDDLADVLDQFRQRDRRFGGLSLQPELQTL